MHEDQPPVPPKTSAEERESRAQQTLKRILAGGDLGSETRGLSNDFTDEYFARFRAWLRRLTGRSPRPPESPA